MRVFALLSLVLTACSFDGSTQRNSNSVGDAGTLLADANAIPDATSCVPGSTRCVGDELQSCLPTGDGFALEDCDFTCVEDERCVGASNVSRAVLDRCEGAAAALTPPLGGTLSLVDNTGTAEIRCSPDCGDGATTAISAQPTVVNAASPDLAVFCLTSFDLPTDMRLTAAASLPYGIVFLVDDTVTIAGGLNFRGSSAGLVVQGRAGPGGGVGGAQHTNQLVAGEGDCPGQGGRKGNSAGGDDSNIGGGGGGAGHGGLGGAGRPGYAIDGTVIMGGAGGVQCGSSSLTPLTAGSGGGAGGDGTCGSCGWGGGGGGGALQISSKRSIHLSGLIAANGGAGYFGTSSSHGGGGGGGSGGGVLLEAPSVSVTGSINVKGGNAGDSVSSAGGLGASAMIDGAAGEQNNGNDEAGVGGGGGGGRVRFNAETEAVCTGVSPTAACTVGAMTILSRR